MFDFDKLRGRIKEKLKTEAIFAEKIGITPATLSYKFNGISEFSSTEIDKACHPDILDIPLEEIGIYFFTRKLELNSRK